MITILLLLLFNDVINTEKLNKKLIIENWIVE